MPTIKYRPVYRSKTQGTLFVGDVMKAASAVVSETAEGQPVQRLTASHRRELHWFFDLLIQISEMPMVTDRDKRERGYRMRTAAVYCSYTGLDFIPMMYHDGPEEYVDEIVKQLGLPSTCGWRVKEK